MHHPSFPRASKAEPHRYAQGGQSGPAPRPVWPSSQPRWASAALQRVRAPRHVDQAVIVFRSRGGRSNARADSGGYACEHAFVSIKGGDYRWLKQALERGDLPLVKASAAQLPAVDLPTALDIGVLAMEREPHNAERAAVRWLGRWAPRVARGDGRAVRARARARAVGGGAAAARELVPPSLSLADRECARLR